MMSPRAAALQGGNRQKKYRKAAQKRSARVSESQQREAKILAQKGYDWYVPPDAHSR